MPVLTRGVIPSSTTLRRSMPVGVPRKSSGGVVKCLCSATVISYISSVAFRASWGVPLTKVTMAGAAAMANPPMPAVSVMVLSPMSALASSLEKPGKYRPTGTVAGAVNQRSPSPLTRIPKSVPLRAMAVTSVLPATPWGAGARHRLAGRHNRVEHAEGVVAQEAQDLFLLGGILGHLGDAGRQLLEVEQGAGLVTVVAFVAHVQRFGQQCPQIDPLSDFQGGPQDRRHGLVHPAQLGQHFRAVSAVTQHLPVP